MTDTEIATLQSEDGLNCKVTVKIANMSGTLKDLIEDAGVENIIPLPTISGAILKIIIEYLKFHVNDEKDSKDILPRDEEIVGKEHNTQFALLLAGNYLDIKGLTHLMCTIIARKAMSNDDMKIAFGIKKDFTPEEKAQVLKENEWCKLE